MLEIFGQTLQGSDLAVVGMLVVLEGVLSIDNALVLGLLAKRLPKREQSLALTYGLVGAFVFRVIAIGTAQYLFKWHIVKFLGGAYLAYVALKHLLFEAGESHDDRVVAGKEGEPELVDAVSGKPLTEEQEELEIHERVPLYMSPAERKQLGLAAFWPTVAVIELTDIAFAVDSILAAIAMVGSPPPGYETAAVHPKMWVVVTGGVLGLMLMRVAAFVFIKLLDKFPRFELAAYLLVLVIGGKLLVDWWFNDPKAEHHVIDFHSPSSMAFWIFWSLMLVCLSVGFIPRREKK